MTIYCGAPKAIVIVKRCRSSYKALRDRPTELGLYASRGGHWHAAVSVIYYLLLVTVQVCECVRRQRGSVHAYPDVTKTALIGRFSLVIVCSSKPILLRRLSDLMLTLL